MHKSGIVFVWEPHTVVLRVSSLLSLLSRMQVVPDTKHLSSKCLIGHTISVDLKLMFFDRELMNIVTIRRDIKLMHKHTCNCRWMLNRNYCPLNFSPSQLALFMVNLEMWLLSSPFILIFIQSLSVISSIFLPLYSFISKEKFCVPWKVLHTKVKLSFFLGVLALCHYINSPSKVFMDSFPRGPTILSSSTPVHRNMGVPNFLLNRKLGKVFQYICVIVFSLHMQNLSSTYAQLVF